MGHHVCAHPDGHQHGGRKPTETSVTEFCYKNVNLFLEELKNIKIIPFLIQEPVQIAKFPEISPEISHFLTNLAAMEMPSHAKAWKFKHSLSQNQEPIRRKNSCKHWFSAALNITSFPC